AVRALDRERDAGSARHLEALDDAPGPAREALWAAVQVVRAVVGGERMAAPVEYEARATDAVREAPDAGAEVRLVARVRPGIGEREDDVAEPPGAVRRAQ